MSYSFSDRIKKFMELQGIKQVALAQKAGRSQSTINRAIHSASIPRLDTLQNIAHALDVPAECLTHPDDAISTIIYELSRMKKEEIEHVLQNIKKEKLWKDQLAAESSPSYGSPSRYKKHD